MSRARIATRFHRQRRGFVPTPNSGSDGPTRLRNRHASVAHTTNGVQQYWLAPNYPDAA